MPLPVETADPSRMPPRDSCLADKLITPPAAKPTPAPATTKNRDLPSLTGMRWAAAFLVFIYHVRNFGYFGGEPGHLVDWAFGAGAVGVSFFFILSGFVLAWTARERDTVFAFWRRRMARIYPVHLITALLALALACTFVPSLLPRSASEGVANILLVSSWRHAWWQALNPVSWSLTCEAFFYAVFPALHAGLRRLGPRGLAALVVASITAVVVLPWVSLHYAPGWAIASQPLARLPEFVLGAAAGQLIRIGAWRGLGLDASLGLTIIGYFLTRQLPPAYGTAACTIVGLGLLIPAAATADLSGSPSLWRHRWLVRAGQWSFAFYMIHILVMRSGRQLFPAAAQLAPVPGAAFTALVFVTSLALARALYSWIELPGRRLILAVHRSHSHRLAADGTDQG